VNWVVLKPASCTIETWTFQPWCLISVMTDSVKFLQAAVAPQ